jgi:hypothetical protein
VNSVESRKSETCIPPNGILCELEMSVYERLKRKIQGLNERRS